MSAIAGLLHRNGAAQDGSAVERMLIAMRARGPDYARVFEDDRVGLGFAALNTTPEAWYERQPVVDERTGTVVVADCRLDNRAELLDRLGVRSSRTGPVGDGSLLLYAYREWGVRFVDHLLGDFAVAVWDPQRASLLLARDHFGVRPLFYRLDREELAFASEARALLPAATTRPAVNRSRMIDFVIDRTEEIDVEGTFFAGISRLAPATVLVVAPNSVHTRRYWRLEAPAALRLSSDREYREALTEALGAAVAVRSRGRDDVGVMLSGGIDSGAVALAGSRAGVARSFSGVSSDPACAESRRIAATIARIDLDATVVTPAEIADRCGPWEATIGRADDLFDAYMGMPRTVFSAAADAGRRSLLTGLFADEVVAVGLGDAVRMQVRCGRVGAAAGQLLNGISAERFPKREAARLLAIAVADASPLSPMLRRSRTLHWGRDRAALIARSGLILSPAERLGLDQRLLVLQSDGWQAGDSPAAHRLRQFDRNFLSAALGRYDRAAAAASLEVRHPYLDVRFVRFCLSLPVAQLFELGWPKAVLRHAVSATLPHEVVWNPIRSHVGHEFTKAWRGDAPVQSMRGWVEHPLRELVDRRTIEAYVGSFSGDGRAFPSDLAAAWHWLDAVA